MHTNTHSLARTQNRELTKKKRKKKNNRNLNGFAWRKWNVKARAIFPNQPKRYLLLRAKSATDLIPLLLTESPVGKFTARIVALSKSVGAPSTLFSHVLKTRKFFTVRVIIHTFFFSPLFFSLPFSYFEFPTRWMNARMNLGNHFLREIFKIVYCRNGKGGKKRIRAWNRCKFKPGEENFTILDGECINLWMVRDMSRLDETCTGL